MASILCLMLVGTVCIWAREVEETESERFMSGDYEYIVLEDDTAEIVGYSGSEESLIIPGELDGRVVTDIGDWAFSWCESLTSIEIPDSVSKIGTNPFMGCDNLREFYISPDSEYLAVIDGILYNKQDKGLVCYPCAKQDLSFVIPSGIEVIGDYAFFVCSSLTSIEIPDTVTKIGDSAFSWCESLTSIEIPDTVTSIGDWAFSWCESLTSIEIPDTVTSIGEGAFSGCDNLTLTVPRDSYVKQYCIDNGLKYTYADSLDWLTN